MGTAKKSDREHVTNCDNLTQFMGNFALDYYCNQCFTAYNLNISWLSSMICSRNLTFAISDNLI